MKVVNRKADTRGIAILPCECGHGFDRHKAYNNAGIAGRWSQDKVVIRECLVAGCKCCEFIGDKAA